MTLLSNRKVFSVSAFLFPCINVFTRPYSEVMCCADMQGDGSLWSSLSSCQIKASQDLFYKMFVPKILQVIATLHSDSSDHKKQGALLFYS